MKDYTGKITLDGKEYPFIFNLNVMEQIQEEYGTFEKWGKLTDGKNGEVNAKALIFGMTAMYNEAVDIANEEQGANLPFFTKKQIGRLVSRAGLQASAEALNNAVVEATKGDSSKNA